MRTAEAVAKAPPRTSVKQGVNGSLPVLVILDSLFARNVDVPVAHDKPAAQKYSELMDMLYDILHNRLQNGSARASREVPFTKLFSIAEMIIYSLNKTEEILVEAMRPLYAGDYITCHSLNVAFLSAQVGVQTKFPHAKLCELVVAGLLHDIGMARIGIDAYTHDHELSNKEREAVEQHPLVGFQFLAKVKSDYPWLLRVVLEEHKREHNMGYPADTQSTEMHPYSRIIGLCDTFESLSHCRAYRKAYHPADVMKRLVEAREMLFAKDSLRSLIASLSLYPIGSIVQLNNKKYAQVVESGEESPLRPVVRILEGSEHEIEVTDEKIDLARDNVLYITGLVYTENYQSPETLRIS